MHKEAAPYLFIAMLVLLGFSYAAKSQPAPIMSASVIRDATVLEYTPDFTDLYIIQIQYKGKSVRIYCNSSSCYKQRNKSLFA